MKKYYKERFEAQRRISRNLANTMEVNEILETLRAESRNLVPLSMETCIIMLDPDAQKYTRPLQCALYDRPVNCLSCKKNRPAIQKAVSRRKGVVISKTDPIIRPDGTTVDTGPEAAMPVFVNDEILAVINVVSQPGVRFTKKDFYLMKDLSELAGNAIMVAKNHWAITQEKIEISQKLAHLSPFVPQSVRRIVESNPELLNQEKESRDVSVLFLDLSIFGFFFMAALYYLEKGDRVLEGLVVTPLRVVEYLTAKIATLTALSVVVGAVVTLAVYGVSINWGWYVLAVVGMSVPISLLGFVLAARYNGINEFLVPGVFFLVVMQLPLLGYLGIWDNPLLYLIPSQPGMILLKAAFTGAALWEIGYALLYLVALVLVGWRWAEQTFVRVIARQVGNG